MHTLHYMNTMFIMLLKTTKHVKKHKYVKDPRRKQKQTEKGSQ